VRKPAKVVLAIICVGLLSLVSARHAYAQDAGETDEDLGAWSAPGADNADLSTDNLKTHPLKIKGCWSGDVVDTADGTGTVTFQFHQNSNRKKIVVPSAIQFEWPDSAKATVPIKGAVTSSGFTFKGNAGANCPMVTGTASGDATGLTGKVVFVGGCETFFQNVTFSIAPGCP